MAGRRDLREGIASDTAWVGGGLSARGAWVLGAIARRCAAAVLVALGCASCADVEEMSPDVEAPLGCPFDRFRMTEMVGRGLEIGDVAELLGGDLLAVGGNSVGALPATAPPAWRLRPVIASF